MYDVQLDVSIYIHCEMITLINLLIKTILQRQVPLYSTGEHIQSLELFKNTQSYIILQ